MDDSILWYTRKKGTEVKGPFSVVIINKQLSIGRLKGSDEVSKDQIRWLPVSKLVEFWADRSKNTVTQLDERDGYDRRQTQSTNDTPVKRDNSDRRAIESDEEIRRRQLRTKIMQRFRNRKQMLFWPIFIIALLIALVLWLGIFHAEPLPISQADCNASALPNVNWENCVKPKVNLENTNLTNAQLRNSHLAESNLMNAVLTGANLAYANLQSSNLSYSQMQNAILKGANLKNADLSYADLSNSDLSYADLRHANLGGSKLDNARFDHAIWINGQTCAPHSIGQCKIVDR